MLIEDAVKEYIYEIQIRNYMEKTIKGYKNNILEFAQYVKSQCEAEELKDIVTKHIKQYLNSLNERGRSSIYINTLLKNLRSFFKYCYEDGYCKEDGLDSLGKQRKVYLRILKRHISS